MKTANRWILFGTLIAGLIGDPSSLLAQPAGKPAPTGTAPAPTGGAPAPAGGSSAPATGAPAPAGNSSAPAGGASAPADGDPVAADDPDKPWNQSASAEDRTAARALFLEGNRLFRIPLFAKAAEQYSAALAKWKHPAFYFNLALAQLNLGKEVEAHENLQRSLEYGEAPLGAEQFREAQKQLQEVKRQIGQIRITCQTRGAEVTLDGATLFIGPGSYQGWVKAKSHEITAKSTGYLAEARRVTVSAGQTQDIELKLVTLGEATDASRRWATWKPWAVVAVGGAIAVAGGGLHALAFKNFSDYDDQFRGLSCADSSQGPALGCTEDEIGSNLNAQLRHARQEQSIAVGAYIVGGSLIAAGVVLLYLNRPQLTEQRAPTSSVSSVVVTPAIARDAFGIAVLVHH